MNKGSIPGDGSDNMVVRAFIAVVLTVLSFLQVFPFYLKLMESFQPATFLPDSGRLYIWPESWNVGNYIEAWKMSDLGMGFLNSIIISFSYTLFSAIMIVVVGYVLAKLEFIGKKLVFLALISTMMVPGEVTMLTNYILVSDLGFMGTRAAVILPGIVNIFGIFMAKQFMESIPDSVLESVRMDGAGQFIVISRIIVPLSMPVIATYVILTVVSSWNEYLWPNLILSEAAKFTVQLKLMYFEGRFASAYDGILKSCGIILTVFPVVGTYLVFQKQFVEGISISGLK